MKTIEDIQVEIIDEFEVFDDWMDRYSYLIELAETLPMIDEKLKDNDHLIDGCQSRVWIDAELVDDKLILTGDSDAIIVKGLVALLLRVYTNHTPKEIYEADLHFIEAIGMKDNLSPTRANGLVSMITRIRQLAFNMMA